MKFYPYSVYDFGCPHCGAKAASRCIEGEKRTWSIAHAERWRLYEHAVKMHGPMPQYVLVS